MGVLWSAAEDELLWHLYVEQGLSAREVAERLRAQLEVERSVRAVYRRIERLRAARAIYAERARRGAEELYRIWRRKTSNARRKDAITSGVIDMLIEAVQRVPRVKWPKPAGVDKSHVRFPPETAVLLLGDLHIGALVRSHQAGGRVYDYQIFRSRLNFLARKVCNIGYTYPADFTSLVILGLGDYVDGQGIFEGQQTCLETRMQFACGLYDLASFFLQLLSVFPRIHILSVSGNHARGSGTRDENRDKDFDWILMVAVAAALSEYSDRITFDLPLSPSARIDIRGYRFHIEHGHQLSCTSTATIQRDVLKVRSMEPFDYFAMGHVHHPLLLHMPNSVGGGKILVNSSFVGASELSYHRIRDAAEPSQWFIGINEDYGMTFAYDLRLDEARQSRRTRPQSIW